MKVETSGLREMHDALRKYELASSKTREQVLEHRANRFAWSLFGVFQGQGRITAKKIKAVDARRMKVRAGRRSKPQEKARRIFAAGFVATGWIPAMRALTGRGNAKPMANVKNPKGSVRIVKGKFIELINSTPGAYEADERHKLSDKAAKKQAEDMRKYLQKKADQDITRSWR